MYTDMRKLQKSRTGWYINIPKKLESELNLKGGEVAKITKEDNSNKIIVEIINLNN